MFPKAKQRIWLATMLLCMIFAVCYQWGLSDLYPEYDRRAEKSLRAYVDSENVWAISHNNSVRKGRFNQVDATDTLLYMSYSKDSCVNVYNHDGEFQYAILFPDKQNGGVSIRCVDNQLYVSDKSNILYVFEAQNEIIRMDSEKARACGYDYNWFINKGAYQKIENGTLYLLNSKREVIDGIPLPVLHPDFNLPRVLVFMISLLLYLCTLWKYYRKVRK